MIQKSLIRIEEEELNADESSISIESFLSPISIVCEEYSPATVQEFTEPTGNEAS